MPCKTCGSANLKKFPAEMCFKSSEPKNTEKPDVWLFPEVLVCLNCGDAAFAVPEKEIGQFRHR
jgi:hypothetical protein